MPKEAIGARRSALTTFRKAVLRHSNPTSRTKQAPSHIIMWRAIGRITRRRDCDHLRYWPQYG